MCILNYEQVKEFENNTINNYKSTNCNEVIKLIKNKPTDANKGSIGKLFCFCGSVGMHGSAVLAAKAALRCGVGLVKMGVTYKVYQALSSHLIEPVFYIINENNDENNKKNLLNEINKFDACLIGCGLGLSENVIENVEYLIENLNVPIIIDADGINIISKNINILNKAKNKVVITPHPGEMARLLNTTVNDIQSNRHKYANMVANTYKVVVVLKGKNTVISSPYSGTYVNYTGNEGMATGGSGDVLAGIISSLIAQGLNVQDASTNGVYIHGLAGDIIAKKKSKTYMLPEDIINGFSDIFLKMEQREKLNNL